MDDVSGTDPEIGSNLPPIKKLAAEMTHHAALWARNAKGGEKHQREIMVRAYQLCLWAEDPDTEFLTVGLLSMAGIPQTKRSHRCTSVLRYAFHKAECEPEPSQLSRWAWTLQHALNHNPRPAPDELLRFIKDEGGEVACREKAREVATKVERDRRKGAEKPKPIPLPCVLPDALDGRAVTVRKTETGDWELIPHKVLSLDTTPSQAPAPAASQ
jgi:hypothetical protein